MAESNVLELKEVMQKALNKINERKEKEICKYLPGHGGYMHHLTMKKLIRNEPEKFGSLVHEFIMTPIEPKKIKPKQRATRNTLSKLLINDTEAIGILKLAVEVGDHNLVEKMKQRISFSKIKKDLIKSIKNDSPDANLWKIYVDQIQMKR